MNRLGLAAVGSFVLQLAHGGSIEVPADGAAWIQPEIPTVSRANNASLPAHMRAPTPQERAQEREARARRHRERKLNMKEAIRNLRPDPEQLEFVPAKDLEKMPKDHPVLRGLGWMGGGSSNAAEYANPGEDYDMWQQAYRMLGGFIDCDHYKDQGGSHDSGDNNNNDNQDGVQPCSRWMMWASYIDPNYEGGGYYEYHGDDATGALDCHNPDTEWQLLGVYRQEFYQYIEQISKHLWAIDEYEYVVALAGLSYMTDADCFYVGTTNSGTSIKAGIAPQPEGKFQMALYTDDYCLTPDTSLGMTYDDFGLYTNAQLESGDHGGEDGNNGGGGGGDYNQYTDEWWQETQEYTLTMLNDVYEDFKYCTLCIDYPTYQDGYVIGSGYDDDDVINQCWKFYSHDSFNCESDCIAKGHSQGTIVSISVGDKVYGKPLQGYYTANKETSKAAPTESQFSRLLANAFVTFSFIVFIATFLAFAVARRSRYRESRSSKSRRLLADDERRRRKSSSRSRRRDDEGDGLFRTKGGSRSKSGTRRKSSGQSRSRGRTEEGDYVPPARSSSRRRSGSKSRRPQVDDF